MSLVWSENELSKQCIAALPQEFQSKNNFVRLNEFEFNCESRGSNSQMTEHCTKLNGQTARKCEFTEETQMVDVLILGGGLAGLGAATTMSKTSSSAKKKSYLILEAQNQAGGRVISNELIEFSTSPKSRRDIRHINYHPIYVDGGAQWLHGRHNYLFKLAENCKLLTTEQSDEGLGSFFYGNCEQIDPFLVEKVNFHIRQLLQECETFVHNSEPVTYPKSVGHFLRQASNAFIDSFENEQDKIRARDLFEWHMRFQIVDNSCLTLDHVSAKYWGKYSFNGESCQAHYNFKNGFHSIVNCLINDSIHNSIHYNKVVTEIRIHDASSEFMSNVSVKCSDGSVYQANHVIVTFSLGILKKSHNVMFHPPLPGFMQTAIESIGFGTINKIFLQFDTPWWNELDGIQFVFKQNDKKTKWTEYLTGFDILQPHDQNIILGWVGGAGAIQMEALSDIEIIKDCVHLLTRFTNINVPNPLRYYRTRWHSNPFVHGAYSYISTDCDFNETISNNILSRPLAYDEFYPTSELNDKTTTIHKQKYPSKFKRNLPVVFFAGEACHERYFSTAHGAFLSGVEQAEKIVELFEKT